MKKEQDAFFFFFWMVIAQVAAELLDTQVNRVKCYAEQAAV